MRALARELGVSTMATYYYFKDKDEILAEVLRQAFDRFVTVLDKAGEIEGNAFERARAKRFAYSKLALAAGLPQLRQIEQDLRDRFGKFGHEVKALLLVTAIRIRAEQKNISSVETAGNRLKLLRASGRHDDWVMLGTRFPRLTASSPLLRLREIVTYLNNLP